MIILPLQADKPNGNAAVILQFQDALSPGPGRQHFAADDWRLRQTRTSIGHMPEIVISQGHGSSATCREKQLRERFPSCRCVPVAACGAQQDLRRPAIMAADCRVSPRKTSGCARIQQPHPRRSAHGSRNRRKPRNNPRCTRTTPVTSIAHCSRFLPHSLWTL